MSDSRSPWERDQVRPHARVAARLDLVEEILGAMTFSEFSEMTGSLIHAISLMAEAVEILNDRMEDEWRFEP